MPRGQQRPRGITLTYMNILTNIVKDVPFKYAMHVAARVIEVQGGTFRGGFFETDVTGGMSVGLFAKVTIATDTPPEEIQTLIKEWTTTGEVSDSTLEMFEDNAELKRILRNGVHFDVVFTKYLMEGAEPSDYMKKIWEDTDKVRHYLERIVDKK